MSGTSSLPTSDFTFRHDPLPFHETNCSSPSNSEGGDFQAVMTLQIPSVTDSVISGDSINVQDPAMTVLAGPEADLTTSAGPAMSREGSASVNNRLDSPPVSDDPVHHEVPQRDYASPLNMGDVALALDSLVTGPATRTHTPESQTSLAVPRPTTRRRSSPRVPPVFHKVEDEELPNDLFHTLTFQESLAKTKQLMSDLGRVLGSGSIHLEPDSSMRDLHERAGILGRFQPLSTRTVGFVGDTGVGEFMNQSATGVIKAY